MADHVFICYAREDEEFVLKFAKNLKERGVSVWLDQWDIPTGANWNRTIDQAIDECAQFLIVLSQSAIESQEVEGEWLTALDENKPVVPVICQECRLPRQLRPFQHVDFAAGGPDDSTALTKVMEALTHLKATPPEPPKRKQKIKDSDLRTDKPERDGPSPGEAIQIMVFQNPKVRLVLLFLIVVIGAIMGWYLIKYDDPFLKFYVIAVIVFCIALWLIMKYNPGETQKKAVIYLLVFAAFFAILAVSWRYFEVTNYLDPTTKIGPPTGYELTEDGEGLVISYTPYYIPYFILLGACLFVTFALIFYYTADKKSIENRIPIIGWFLGFSIVIGLCRLIWQIIDWKLQ